MSEAKAIAILLATLIIAVVGTLSIQQVMSWKHAAEVNGATVTQQAATASAASAITSDLSTKTNDAQRVDLVITEKRGEYVQQVEELARRNPAVADWRDQPVPDELRNLARARRAARDGLGSDEAGSGAADEGAGGGGFRSAPRRSAQRW